MQIVLLVILIIGFAAIAFLTYTNMENVKRHDYALKELANQYKKLLGDVKDLNTEIKQSGNAIKSLDGKEKNIDNKIADLERRISSIAKRSVTTENTRTVVQTVDVTSSSNSIKPINKNNEGTFYAKAYDMGESMVLKILSDTMQNSAPFIVKYKGNSGTIKFNEKGLSRNVENLEVNVIAFCDVDFQAHDKIQGIDNLKEGDVSLKNDGWIITKRPQIKIY